MSDKKDDKPTSPPEADAGMDAKKHMASVNASSMAAASKQSQAASATSVTDFVKFSRALLEFQMLALKAQLDFLNELSDMSDEEKLTTLFELLDEDQDGQIDARELAAGLRKVDESLAFSDSLAAAVETVATFDTDEDAKLSLFEFKSFLDTLLGAMGCTFHELSELLVMLILFSDSGNTMLETAVGEAISEDLTEITKGVEEFNAALIDKRMVALFKLFDINGDGRIEFTEVAVGLYKITDDMDESTKAAWELLLMFSDEGDRTLDYPQFTQLIMNLVAADPDKTFDDVADAMTKAMSQPIVMTEEDLACLVVTSEMQAAVAEMEQVTKEVAELVDAVEYGRMQRLFDLWDLDKSGYIEFSELVMGMRKFTDANDLESTVEESVAAMLMFDANDDQKLDRVEFAAFLIKFAKAAEVDLHELVDFMVVISALKDNDEAERAFIESVGKDATEKIKLMEAKMREAALIEGESTR